MKKQTFFLSIFAFSVILHACQEKESELGQVDFPKANSCNCQPEVYSSEPGLLVT